MKLRADQSRCLGLLPAPDGEQRCPRRDDCARYVQRHTGGDATQRKQWMCPGLDDYWQHFIPEER